MISLALDCENIPNVYLCQAAGLTFLVRSRPYIVTKGAEFFRFSFRCAGRALRVAGALIATGMLSLTTDHRFNRLIAVQVPISLVDFLFIVRIDRRE